MVQTDLRLGILHMGFTTHELEPETLKDPAITPVGGEFLGALAFAFDAETWGIVDRGSRADRFLETVS